MRSPAPLFDDARPARSVSALLSHVRDVVENGFDDVWVEGELSNFKRHHSGHCYFTLKDSAAQLRCVLWRHFADYVYFQPRDGLSVRLHGGLSVYERRGDLQMVVRSMRLAGEGALQKAFEALRNKLADEGLFDAVHKRPLPRYPETIGIVTSTSGAALYDILSVLERRFPSVRVLVCPVQVQGVGAAEAIAEAVVAFNAVPAGDVLRADVLIIGRGGGSAEDLWAFNEEVVARAVFASRIPVISAVGHEVDYSIADFVADVRAATPSMAAEVAVPNRHELKAYVLGLHGTLHDRVVQQIVAARQRVRYATGTYAFRRPIEELRQQRHRLDDLVDRLHRAARRALQHHETHVASLVQHLSSLDPGRPLHRGYAWVEQDGRPVSSAEQLEPGTTVLLRFHDDSRRARIEP